VNSTYISVPNSPSLQTGAPLSIVAWIRTSTLAGGPDIVRKGGSNTVVLYASPSPSRAVAEYYNGVDVQINTQGPLTDGGWHLLALTLTTSRVSIYVDDTASASAAISGSTSGTTAPLTIGSSSYAGLMDMVSVYNRALSPAEVQQLYVQPYAMMAPPPRRLFVARQTFFTQTIAVTQASTAGLAKQASKTLPVQQASTAGVAKQASKTIAAQQASAAALTKRTGKTIAVQQSSGASVAAAKGVAAIVRGAFTVLQRAFAFLSSGGTAMPAAPVTATSQPYVLRPTEKNVGFSLDFTKWMDTAAGEVIASATVKVMATSIATGNVPKDVTSTILIGAPTISSNVVTVLLGNANAVPGTQYAVYISAVTSSTTPRTIEDVIMPIVCDLPQ
jgi:hypothetical protein